MKGLLEKDLQRKFWLDSMLKITTPVLFNLKEGKLKATMPVEQKESDRRPFACLEAFGRTLCGIAPWIEATNLSVDEEKLRAEYEEIILIGLDNATNENSPDYMNFCESHQPLVDAAFLAHGLVRAEKNLIGKMSDSLKEQVIKALKKSRVISPGPSNWLLFTGMVEAALYLLGDADYDMLRVKYGLRNFYTHWYKGDSMYGDGAAFHMDYYNSFVIQPMLVDISKVFSPIDEEISNMSVTFIERASRYAEILERFISPEGTYPIVGRSIVYRFGAFQMLSQAALQHTLVDTLSPAQVRCGLTSIMQNIMSSKGMFDENDWLKIGVYGHQPSLGESYISSGSLYLCCAVFLPLGLSPEDSFWKGENEKWTNLKVFEGEDLDVDHSIPN